MGCGHGNLLLMGKHSFRSAVGCDPSAEMLRSCAELNVKHQRSLDQLPFDDGQFDLVTAVCVYHHVPETHRLPLCKETVRLLRPGGVLCIVEHNPFNPVTRLIVSRTPVDADAVLLSMGETERLLRYAECRVVKSHNFLFLPERVYRRFSAIIPGSPGSQPAANTLYFARKDWRLTEHDKTMTHTTPAVAARRSPTLWIVVPCFNEEEVLEKTTNVLSGVPDTLEHSGEDFEPQQDLLCG